MIIFADASALIATIACEDDADALANLLESGTDPALLGRRGV